MLAKVIDRVRRNVREIGIGLALLALLIGYAVQVAPIVQGQPEPTVPTVVSVQSTFITTSGAGIQKYVVTPSVQLVSNTSEVVCTPNFANGTTDVVLPPYISATTVAAGTPPNYIVLQISSSSNGTYRCSVLRHPF